MCLIDRQSSKIAVASSLQGSFVVFLTVLVMILCVFLGGPIWRLFEQFGLIFWPVRDLFISLRWLTYRWCWKNSNIGGEVCVT